jgi:DNA-binding MarR family transcriptional regulator
MTPPGETLIYDALEVIYKVVEETDEYVTEVLRKLAEKGLVRRGSDAKDRRRTTVALTAAGIRVRKRMTRAVLTGTSLAQLESEELRTLVTLLEKAMAGRPERYRM